MASDRNCPWFRRVMKLPMAAFGSSDAPAIFLKALDYVANFHADHRPLATALFQLLLPAQHPRLVAFRLGLGNHSLLLIEDREAGVGQNVVGIDF